MISKIFDVLIVFTNQIKFLEWDPERFYLPEGNKLLTKSEYRVKVGLDSKNK